MSESSSPLGDMVAAARVAIDGTFADTKPYGFSAVGLAAGVFTLTLSNPIDALSASVKVTPQGLVASSATYEHTADDTITVSMLAGADVLTAAPFAISVHRKAIS